MTDLNDKRRNFDADRNSNILTKSDEELFESVGTTTISMACPQDKVGPLIGKKGVVVQEIMKKSSCRIYVDQNFPDGVPRQIQMTGHPRDLSIALTLCMLVMDQGPGIISPLLPPSKETMPLEEGVITESDFICPSAKVGALIGPKGNNVHEIYKRTACKIQVHQEGLPDTADRRVSFTGTPEQIQEAKALCNALLKDAGNGMVDIHSVLHTQGHTTAASSAHTNANGQSPLVRITESEIDPEKVRLVIGARGVTIGEIMKRSGCKVFVNQNFPAGENHKVVYTGSPIQIDVAKYLVEVIVTEGMGGFYNILSGTERIVIQEVTLRNNGNGLNTLYDVSAEIQSRSGVNVNVDLLGEGAAPATGGLVRVSVIGKLEDVHAAIKQLFASLPDVAPLNASLPVDLATATFATNSLGAPPPPSHIAQHPHPHPHPPHPHPTGPILALGKDGQAGHLESALPLPPPQGVAGAGAGMVGVQQVAEIKNEHAGKLIGPKGAHLSLIKAKSGANVTVINKPGGVGATGGASGVGATTRILLMGSGAEVALAAQMVQEVLVNGTAKLLKMADAVKGGVKGVPGGGGGDGGGEYFPPYYPSPQPMYAPQGGVPMSAQAAYSAGYAGPRGPLGVVPGSVGVGVGGGGKR